MHYKIHHYCADSQDIACFGDGGECLRLNVKKARYLDFKGIKRWGLNGVFFRFGGEFQGASV